MKRFVKIFGFVALTAMAVGCQKEATVKGTGGKELTLTVPAKVTLDAGAASDVTVKIHRTNFETPVDVSFGELPKGVEVRRDSFRLAGDEGLFQFVASADAMPVTNFRLRVIAEGPDGMQVSQTISVMVRVPEAKGRIEITPPKDLKLTRGETVEVSVGLARTGAVGPVRVDFHQLPRGVKANPAGTVIDGDAATFVISAQGDADLVGKHVVKITAHSREGVVAEATFRITVVGS